MGDENSIYRHRQCIERQNLFVIIHPSSSSSREMVLSREFSTQKTLSLTNATSCFRLFLVPLPKRSMQRRQNTSLFVVVATQVTNHSATALTVKIGFKATEKVADKS
jgi:hypothetical protein